MHSTPPLPQAFKDTIGDAPVGTCSVPAAQTLAGAKPSPAGHLCLCLLNSEKCPQSHPSCRTFSKATRVGQRLQGDVRPASTERKAAEVSARTRGSCTRSQTQPRRTRGKCVQCHSPSTPALLKPGRAHGTPGDLVRGQLLTREGPGAQPCKQAPPGCPCCWLLGLTSNSKHRPDTSSSGVITCMPCVLQCFTFICLLK